MRCGSGGEVQRPCELRRVARACEESQCECATRGQDVGMRRGRRGERQRSFEFILRECRRRLFVEPTSNGVGMAHTKPAELKTAPLPELKSGLSEHYPTVKV